MRYKGKIALLVAIAISLFGLDARADQKTDVDSQGRTAEDVIRESRARIERQSKERERKKQLQEDQRIGWYGGLGVEFQQRIPQDGVYRIRAAQRDKVPLIHLAPVDDSEEPLGDDAYSFFVGYELRSWLDLELSAHNVNSFDQWYTSTPAVDIGTGRRILAGQYSMSKERTYSVTALPRWRINSWLSAYGRLGIGYTDSSVVSTIKSSTAVGVREQCDTQTNGSQHCYQVTLYEDRDWNRVDEKYSGFFPIGGLGVEVWQAVTLEYLYRANEPFAGGDVDVNCLYIRFKVRNKWF